MMIKTDIVRVILFYIVQLDEASFFSLSPHQFPLAVELDHTFRLRGDPNPVKVIITGRILPIDMRLILISTMAFTAAEQKDISICNSEVFAETK